MNVQPLRALDFNRLVVRSAVTPFAVADATG
jgi:hypothetical protein